MVVDPSSSFLLSGGLLQCWSARRPSLLPLPLHPRSLIPVKAPQKTPHSYLVPGPKLSNFAPRCNFTGTLAPTLKCLRMIKTRLLNASKTFSCPLSQQKSNSALLQQEERSQLIKPSFLQAALRAGEWDLLLAHGFVVFLYMLPDHLLYNFETLLQRRLRGRWYQLPLQPRRWSDWGRWCSIRRQTHRHGVASRFVTSCS